MKSIRKSWLAGLLMAAVLVTMMGVPVKAASKGYVFRYKGVKVAMNGNASTLKAKAGKPISQRRSKSCAYNGLDSTYVYKDFIVTTYSKSVKGAEYINSITLRTAKVSTSEGIHIGSTYNDVVKKYGKGKQTLGVYVYTKGRSKLQIEVKNNTVSKIMYLAK